MPSDGSVRDFAVPDLGEGLEEATVVEWYVAAGDRVELNQPLCCVETAKAVIDIPSPHAGIVVERHGEVGDTLAVGSPLARIDTGGGDPPAAAPARQAVLVGYGVEAEGDRTHRRPRPLAKPPVRLLARRLGVDLRALAPGSGPGGAVTRQDVEEAAEPGDVEVRPVHGVRARVAERMAASRASIPDATCAVEADCGRLLEVRAALARAAPPPDGGSITPFSVLCRLLVLVLRRHPLLNASFDGQAPAVRVRRAVHLGVATATERGLLVPVVHDAHDLGTLALSRAIAEAAGGARAGTLTPERLRGSTFTVSNFGALGLDDGVPAINPPEAAILGVGAIKPRPWVVDGALAVRPTVRLTCVFDHRVCDGAEAGAFLSDLRALVETPELALLQS